MKSSFPELARRRLRVLPPGPPPPELEQAKLDFWEAVISRNYRASQAACEVIARHARPERPLSAAERAKRELRNRALCNFVDKVRELRDEDERGVVRPPATPEQVAAARAELARFRRWLDGDDSAGCRSPKSIRHLFTPPSRTGGVDRRAADARRQRGEVHVTPREGVRPEFLSPARSAFDRRGSRQQTLRGVAADGARSRRQRDPAAPCARFRSSVPRAHSATDSGRQFSSGAGRARSPPI